MLLLFDIFLFNLACTVLLKLFWKIIREGKDKQDCLSSHSETISAGLMRRRAQIGLIKKCMVIHIKYAGKPLNATSCESAELSSRIIFDVT